MFQQALRRTVTPKLAKALTPRATAAMMTIPVAAFGGYNAIKMNNPSAFASTQTNIEHGGLTPADFTALTVSKIDQISADSSVYYFSLSSPTAKLNMPITSYVVAKADVDGEAIFRPYTPLADAEGEMALVVKTYPNAKMGSVFKSLQVGDSMNFKGPLKKFDYTPNQFDHVTMIAGGTGITPIFQLMEAMTANTDDKTTIHLLYGSQTPQDILIKPLIDKMVSEHPTRVKVSYYVDRSDADWDGLTGYITPEAITSVHGAPGNERSKVFVCGPPPMMNAVCGPKGANYTQGVLGDSALGSQRIKSTPKPQLKTQQKKQQTKLTQKKTIKTTTTRRVTTTLGRKPTSFSTTTTSTLNNIDKTSTLFKNTPINTPTPIHTTSLSHFASKVYEPNSSKYLNWVNAPPNLHWRQVADLFKTQGYEVKVDQDAMAPTFFRIKFPNPTVCREAYTRLNGFAPRQLSEPFDLRFGRSFRSEGTSDDLVQARLNVISGPTNLAWTVIKDSLQAYTPVLSVDQVASSTYKVRFYTRSDFDYVHHNLSEKRVQTPIGQEIVFELRPWTSVPGTAMTTAQKNLETSWEEKYGKISGPNIPIVINAQREPKH